MSQNFKNGICVPVLGQRIGLRHIFLFFMKNRFRTYISRPTYVKFFKQKLRYLKNFENFFNSDFDM